MKHQISLISTYGIYSNFIFYAFDNKEYKIENEIPYGVYYVLLKKQTNNYKIIRLL